MRADGVRHANPQLSVQLHLSNVAVNCCSLTQTKPSGCSGTEHSCGKLLMCILVRQDHAVAILLRIAYTVFKRIMHAHRVALGSKCARGKTCVVVSSVGGQMPMHPLMR